MKNLNPIAIMKKYRVWIVGLSLLAGLLCFFLLNRQQSYTATAIIEYTNKTASEGKAPDGSTIDPTEMYSTRVMKAVFDRMGMRYEDYNLDKFRSKVVIKQIMTDEEKAIQEALNDKGETMTTVPTKYAVSITLDRSDAADPQVFARQILENMLDVYLSVYGEEHVSGSIIVNDIVTMEESGFDFIEAVEAIDEDVSDTIASLENIINRGESFRSTSVGYSFADLNREFTLLEENEIPNLYAYILNNRISSDPQVLIAKYRQRIENYKIDNEESLARIRDIKEVIAAYIQMMRESGNTEITYEYILDEVYDNYFKNVTTGSTDADHIWVNPDETIEYEVLLESYIKNRTEYEYALIEIAYCQYIIENYGAEAPAQDEAAEQIPGDPLNTKVGITGDAAGAQEMLNALMNRLDALYADLAVLKAEYNDYSGAQNIGLISNIVVRADVDVMLYTLLLTLFCLIGISAAVIFVDRASDIWNFHIYVDRKFHVNNRAACDRYLARHERGVIGGDTVCIVLNITNLRGKNQTFGREACDSMMIKLVELMKKVFPEEPQGFIALNGQGQFVVFLEGVREAQAKAYMKYLDNEAASWSAQSACPMEYHYGIAEAEKEDIFQMRGLLVCAVNKSNAPAAVQK